MERQKHGDPLISIAENSIQLFNAQTPESENRLDQLRESRQPVILDTYQAQLADWLKISNPASRFSPEALQEAVENHLQNKGDDGVWVYYPWNNTLVHTLNRDAFISVRTNRNKLKITTEEQQILAGKTIGIIGLSVGQSVALALAMERVGGRLKIADFDVLDLSNLNRIRSGIQHIGLPKTVIASREIAELDPFLEVECFHDGITKENIDHFLGGKHPVDLLIEVCDNLDIKVLSRKRARAMQIPVIMDTNDRGMLDVERFDLELGRALFHGLVDESVLEPDAPLQPEQRLGILMDLVSFNQASDRLKLSMTEIGKSLTTWPQLASSVIMGGGMTCDVARKILLGQPVPSGRYYVDLDHLIR